MSTILVRYKAQRSADHFSFLRIKILELLHKNITKNGYQSFRQYFRPLVPKGLNS